MLIYPTTENCTQKTLGAELLEGITASATFNSVTGIQNKKGLFVVDRVDTNGTETPNKREYITFIGTSGNTVTTLVRGLGGSTDQDHAVGAIVEFVSDVVQQQAILDELETINTTVSGLPTADSTTTFSNKRINPRIVTAASYTTDTGTALDVSTCDEFDVTAQAGALKLNNPGGTPVNGQKLIVRIKDNGTAQNLTYDTQFRASTDLALPSTTVLGKVLYLGFIYDSTDSKWTLLAVLNNI